MSKKIKVHVRLRNSANKINENKNNSEQWFVKDNLLHQRANNDKTISYLCYESIFHEEDNFSLFEKCIKENINEMFDGKSLTVFAYGQTGSGKTYTMTGTKENPGIICQSLKEIFNQKSKKNECQISYFEIYNENIIDLVNIKNVPKVYFCNDELLVRGIDKIQVENLESSLKVIEECETKRKIGKTQFNLRSSRSHTIFKLEMKLESKRTVSVTLIDLAGSEKASGNALRIKEGVFINKSLLALGKVMASIHRKEFASFRESKLTRVLQPSMTGNVNLVALCMISPDKSCVEESVNTLKFASRLCQIEMKCKIQMNDEFEKKDILCKRCKKEIENDSQKVSVSDYSDSTSSECAKFIGPTDEGNDKLIKLQEKRILNLESLVILLLKKNPSKRENEIFMLEKNMFNLQVDILSKNSKKNDIAR